MFSEDTTPLIMGPINEQRWIYASAKQLLERVLHAYGLQQDFNYTIIRPFNFVVCSRNKPKKSTEEKEEKEKMEGNLRRRCVNSCKSETDVFSCSQSFVVFSRPSQ